MKTVFTTGQVAKICKVASRTVTKWFDSGQLRGYRIPGSQDRRIPREHLIRFLKEHGMPLGTLDQDGVGKVLLVGPDASVRGALQPLTDDGNFQVESAASGFEAGMQANSLRPDCVIIDFAMGNDEALSIARNLNAVRDQADTVLIALVQQDAHTDAFDRSLFQETFRKPFDPVLLTERVKALVARKKEKV